MATAALAQEKVWFDKPSYDKAERLYFERMAKVMSRKIMENCSLNSEYSKTDNNCQDLIITNTAMNLKTEKSKGNKSLTLNNESNEITKEIKCPVKDMKINKKEDDCSTLKKENSEDLEKCDYTVTKEKSTNNLNDTGKKCNAKEAKDKKNKADTRHRNRGKGKKDIEERKEQLLEQGNQPSTCPISPAGGSLANEVAKARQHIKQSLQRMDGVATFARLSKQELTSRIATLEKENQDLRNVVQDLRNIIGKLDERVKVLEDEKAYTSCPKIAICPPCNPQSCPQEEPEDDVDLFGSDSEVEDAEAAKIREERVAAYAAKKSKKPTLIAKSNIILDVKPWDDETDMKLMEDEVRKVETDGLLWGAAKLVPLAYGIHKLQISCVVEDDKVSVDWLTEKIQDIEEYVQSVDIAAFNKV